MGLSNRVREETAAAHAAGELTDAEAACTPLERKFVYWLMQLPPKRGFQAAAARLAGYGKNSTPTVLNGTIQDLLRKPRVIDLIAEVTRKIMHGRMAPHALAAVQEIIANPEHKDRLKAANLVLERIDPTVQRLDVNVRHEVIDRDKEAVAYLRKLQALGVSREKLVLELGYSDLPRYERLLALEDASKATPVIDGDYAVVDEQNGAAG
jgi:hypothetical protein